MSDTTKTFVFPEGGMGGNGMEGMLLGSMMNGGGFGGGMNSPFWAIIMLAFLRQWGWDGNNGNGCNCLTNNQLSTIQSTLNTNQGQTLLMDAIKGNAGSLRELATTLNCNQNAITAAINGIQAAISGVGNQVGMTSAQVINSIQNGNMQLANTLQSCCCDVKQLVTTQGYETRIAGLEQSNMIQKGFGDVNYATQAQTTALAQNADANTRAVLAKLDQIEDSRKDREINTLTAQLASANARAERQAELAPITKALADIQSKQPSTATVQWPNLVGIPAYQLLGGTPYTVNGGGFL